MSEPGRSGARAGTPGETPGDMPLFLYYSGRAPGWFSPHLARPACAAGAARSTGRSRRRPPPGWPRGIRSGPRFPRRGFPPASGSAGGRAATARYWQASETTGRCRWGTGGCGRPGGEAWPPASHQSLHNLRLGPASSSCMVCWNISPRVPESTAWPSNRSSAARRFQDASHCICKAYKKHLLRYCPYLRKADIPEIP